MEISKCLQSGLFDSENHLLEMHYHGDCPSGSAIWGLYRERGAVYQAPCPWLAPDSSFYFLSPEKAVRCITQPLNLLSHIRESPLARKQP